MAKYKFENYSIVCFDMRYFKTKEDFEKFTFQKKFDVDIDFFWELKLKKSVHRVWVDFMTFNLIAFENHEEQLFHENFLKHLQESYVFKEFDLAPFQPKPRDQKEKENRKSKLSIDNILDKISSSGIDSLTSEERKFLDENCE